MTPRSFVVLLGATAISLAAVVGVLAVQQDGARSGVNTNAPMFAALAQRTRDVSRMRIEGSKYKLLLERRGASWVVPNKGAYPVRAGAASSVVAGLAALKPLEPKTNRPASYPKVAVEDPNAPGANSYLVTVESERGEVLASVIVGKRSASTGFSPLGGTFVREPNEAQTWLAEGTILIPESIGEWLDNIVHVPGPQVRNISILEGSTVVFATTKGEAPSIRYEIGSIDPKYAKPDHRANDSAIKSLPLGIISVVADDVRAVGETKTPPDARTMRFELENGAVLDATLVEADGDTWVRYAISSAPSDGEGANFAKEVRARTEGWAFKLPGYKLAVLRTPVENLIEPTPPPDEDRPQEFAPGQVLTPEDLQRLMRGQGGFSFPQPGR